MTPYIYPGIDITDKIGFISVKKSPNDIKKIICDYYGITIDDLHSKCRKHKFVRARVMTAFFIKKIHSNITNVNLGKLLGGRDHSAITYYINFFNDMLIYKDFLNESIEIKIKLQFS